MQKNEHINSGKGNFFFWLRRALSFGMVCFIVIRGASLVQLLAAPVPYTWTFPSAIGYSLSDANLLEVAADTARLKIREYVSDAQTALLLHLNEVSGNPVDSSSYTHTATANNLTYQSGQLHNGVVIDGITSSLTIQDSVPLSLTGGHTLEAWTKFDDAFQGGVSNQRQGIIDKGDYQLYFDNETGKLVYELADSQATTWIQHAGNYLNSSWDVSGSPNIESMSIIGTNVYVGLGNALGDAQVWKWDGSVWTRVGGDGINNSWGANAYESVYSMTNDGTNLYVGLGLTAGDGEVWRWNGSTWFKVGGDAQYSSWLVNSIEGVYSLYFQNNTLYAGLGLTADDAEVWSCTGCGTDTPSWLKIGGDNGTGGTNGSWTGADNIEYVYSLTGDGTNIYAGLGLSAGDAEVWRWNGSSWAKVGGDGVGSPASWSTSYEYVYSLFFQNNILYAGLGLTAGDAEVWSCTSCASGTPNWIKIGGDTVGWGTTYEGVYSLTGDGTNIYAGLGLSGGEQEIWRWNGSTWFKVGGDGVYSGFTGANHGTVNQMVYANNFLYAGIHSVNAAYSGQVWVFDPNASPSPTWTWLGGDLKNESWSKRGINSIEVLQVSGDALYAGMGYQYAGNAYVWKMQDDNWSLVGGDGSSNGWAPYIYDKVSSMQSYEGDLYVGLGVSANEADLYKLDGSTWSQVGGDGVGWGANFEEVLSQAILGNYLFVGLGNSADDAEVWRYDGANWLKIGGDDGGNGTVFGSWTGAMNVEQVLSLQPYNGKMYAGLGNTNNDAAVWECTGCADPLATPSWTKVGGGGVNESWNTSSLDGFNNVDAMVAFRDTLIASLGTGTGEAEVWEFNGSTWTQIGGGANIRGSWDAGSYERVRTLGVYNGQLYAGLGNGTGDGEVWRYNGTTWTNVAGDGVGWGINLFEEINAISVFEGKLFIGSGNSASADATVWYTGNNRVLKSSTTTQDNAWHHVAAKYDGTTMSLWRDGVSVGSLTTTVSMRDSTSPVIIGATHAGREFGKPRGIFEGMLDEIRISSVSRDSFVTTPYTSIPQSIRPNNPHFTSGVKEWTGFDAVETVAGEGILYRLSIDGGTTWKYWNTGSSAWATSTINFATDDEATIISRMNDKATIDSHISALTARSGGILWQASLNGDGSQATTLTSVTITAEPDTDAPTNPTSITALSESGGDPVLEDTWYAYAHPYFSWSGESDGVGSGVAGYFVVFEEATEVPITPTPPSTETISYVCNDDPEVDGLPQASPTYTAGTLTAGKVYCLRIKTYDYAGNKSGVLNAFTYRFDSTNEIVPDINPVPGFINDASVTFTWSPITNITGAPILKLQYKTGATIDSIRGTAYADWQDLAANATSVTIGGNTTATKASYQDGTNTFYLRVIDTALSIGTPATEVYNSSGEGPSQPEGLSALPLTTEESPATSCAFTFEWDAPTTYLGGNPNNLTYCYSVNIEPNESLCTGKFASLLTTGSVYCDANMRNGLNRFYVVARNPEAQGSTVNYGAASSISFYLDTSEPGPPSNAEVSDISVKSESEWKLTISWLTPELNGEVAETYQIYRSLDGVVFTKIASTSGTAYVDTGLTQQTYYYKVNACDVVQKCGAFTEIVDMYPTGKFTDPATLVSGPTSSDITTKKATISWGTDRASDSKVQYGTSAGSYFTEEPSNSTQVTAHEISLNNLSPGTTYYFKAKWTDEDGNTGSSAEKSFTTEPAPTIKDVAATKVGIDSAHIGFTVTGGTKVKLYYGDTAAFGLVKTLSVGLSETTESVELDDLEDDTKYYYKVNGVDSDGVEYDGTTLSFTTLPRPKVTNVRVQQIVGTAQPAVLVTWTSNTPISSIITYYPTNNPSSVQDEVSVELTSGIHQLILRGLYPETGYSLVVSGRDKAGNEARSDKQTFTTATDTRPPRITNLKIESSTTKVSSGTNEKLAQLIVSWTTDEPATSQVEFGEGAGISYPQKTQEDATYKVNHLVIISNLPTSRVYHVRALSNDSALNTGKSQDTVTITPKGGDDALELVTRNLMESFGFLRNIIQTK